MHVIIEVDSPDCITVQDNHSLNKTWKNGMALKPGVLYGLEDADVITMGEVKLKFLRKDFEEEQSKEAPAPEGNCTAADSSPELSRKAFHVPETPAALPKRRFFPTSAHCTTFVAIWGPKWYPKWPKIDEKSTKISMCF